MSADGKIAILGLLLAALLGAQAPPGDTLAADVPRSRVRGRVVDAHTRAPLKGVKVVIGDRGADIASAEADFEGAFDIADAPAGEQSIRAIKSGYFDYRGRILVPAGREIDGIHIEMKRLAVITGRVTGADGLPFAGATVRVLGSRYLDGRRLYLSEGVGAFSDDRGIFRIWRLDPGQYVVAVEAQAEPGPPGSTVYRAPLTYYPNAMSAAEAAAVRVDWGQVQEEIDVALGPPASTRVDGLVHVDDVGGNCAECSGTLRQDQSPARAEGFSVTINRDGAFSVSGLFPGHYVLSVESWNHDTSSWAFGEAEFTVAEDRLTRVAVDLYGEKTVSGRLVFAGAPESVIGPQAEPWTATIAFNPADNTTFAGVRAAFSFSSDSLQAGQTGFTLKLVPGLYDFGVFPIPGEGYVRSLSMAGQPISRRKIRVPPGGLEDVVITIGFDAGKVAGKVDQGEATVVEAGLLPPRPRVVLIAEPGQALLVDRSFRTANADGSFEIGGLPPGRYRAFALLPDGAYEIEDPAVARKLAPWSKQVEVRPGRTTVVDLTIVPEAGKLE